MIKNYYLRINLFHLLLKPFTNIASIYTYTEPLNHSSFNKIAKISENFLNCNSEPARIISNQHIKTQFALEIYLEVAPQRKLHLL